MKRGTIILGTLAAVALGVGVAFGATSYSQGFEVDTFDWTGATRVASGTNGIASADGAFHAEAANGAFTLFGGYESAFPSGGYTTSIDIYLDVDGGLTNDTRFDWSSAINRVGLNPPFCTTAPCHLRDFVFNAGFYDDATGPGAGDNRFVISASNNAGRANSFPKNPARAPIAITQTGWYTFEHRFYDDGGVLAVDLSIYDSDGNLVSTWTLSDPTDVMSNVGGHRYGWFVQQESPVLAIDNVNLVSISEPGDKNDCKKGGWEALTRADGSDFNNQGDCIQYANTGQ